MFIQYIFKPILLSILLFSAINVHSQEIKGNLYSGYSFNDAVSAYQTVDDYYKGIINSHIQFGVGIEAEFNQFNLELKYINSTTTALISYPDNGEKTSSFDMKMNYFLVSPKGNLFNYKNIIDGYAGADIGLLAYTVESKTINVSSSISRIAWGLHLGSNIWITPRFGIKLHAQILSTLNDIIIIGSFDSSQSGIQLNAESAFYQVSLGGGVVFKIKEKSQQME